MRTHPVDWQADPLEVTPRAETRKRITVVWVHKLLKPADIHTLCRAIDTDRDYATRVLVHWNAYIERLAYCYAGGPSLCMSSDAQGRVRVEAWNTDEDIWKHVTHTDTAP